MNIFCSIATSPPGITDCHSISGVSSDSTLTRARIADYSEPVADIATAFMLVRCRGQTFEFTDKTVLFRFGIKFRGSNNASLVR